jgi:HK97 family phage portal protein
VRLFGYELTLERKAAPLRPPASGSQGWWPIVREPYTGAWQLNDPVTTDTALSNASVFGVVSGIAQDLSKIAPPLLLQQDDNGFWFETTNPAYTPVLRRPNRYQTDQQFLEQWALSRLLTGNVYVLKNYDERGVVNQLDILNPSRVKVLVAPDGSVYYELQADDLAGISSKTPPVVVPARDIIHDRYNCLYHRMQGVSPLYAAAAAVMQAQVIQTSSSAHFAKGGRIGGFLIAPTKLDPLSAERIRADLAEKAQSGSNIIVADFGMKFEPFSATAVNQQLIEQLGWTEEKICEVFRMPISILNSSKQPPYANAEASMLQYKALCLEPHLTAIAKTLAYGLNLPTYLKLEFDDTLLIWMETSTRVSAAKAAIVSGMSPNEVRETYYGLGPVKGGELPYLQQQQWPVAQLSERPAESMAPINVPETEDVQAAEVEA